MPATAHRQWQQDADNRAEKREVDEEWIVVDAPTRDAAYQAVGLPSHNQLLEPGSSLKVRYRFASNGGGPTTWKVRIRYSEGDWETVDDPLNRPAVFSWSRSLRELPSDIDAAGQPVINANGDYFRPSTTSDYQSLFLTIKRYEPFFDYDHYKQFVNTVNSNTFPFSPGASVGRGICCCLNILPAGEYKANAPYLEVLFQFEFREPPPGSGSGPFFPFDEHIPNQGRRAYAAGGKLGYICYANGEKVQEDVKLQANGIPFDTDLKVKTSAKSAPQLIVANPDTTQHITGERLSAYSTSTQVFIRRKRKRESNFALIGL
jgi:hypothetical protein